MAKRTIPTYRDFSKGRITDYSANVHLIPSNSVSNSYNVNFDDTIGSGKVRKGVTAIGSVVASGKTPLGLTEFVGLSGTPNYMLSVFTGASTASLYYYDGSWHTSGLTSLSNSAKCRFASLGGRSFVVNGATMLSSSDGNTWSTTNCITTDSVVPSLLYRFAGRLLAAGYSANKDRIYFSSLIDLSASPTLTWSTSPTAGDWIDVNPDDGDNVTGFSDVSNVVLVFKRNNLYRLSTVTKSTDPEALYNVGAVSQEAITKCQGMVYFYSGNAIYSTNGGYPTQISRLGVQDFIDNVPQANWSNVSMGSDEFNVYVSLGQITMNGLTNYYVLKFSTRDQNWSVHYYPFNPVLFAKYTDSNGRRIRIADSAGYVDTLNFGSTDRGTPIFYSLETQELEFGSRGTTDKMSGHIAAYTKNGQNSKIQVKTEGGDYSDIDGDLTSSVTIIETANLDGRYFKFKWSGVTDSSQPPEFQGLEFPEYEDQGYIPD